MENKIVVYNITNGKNCGNVYFRLVYMIESLFVLDKLRDIEKQAPITWSIRW